MQSLVLVMTLIDMNTKIIPIALIAIIMVAGVFAFVPVQTASTVHETLTNELAEMKDTFCETWNNNINYFYDSSSNSCETD